MNSRAEQIEALNQLILETNQKLASYNQLIKPVIDTEREISRHQFFYQNSKTTEKQKEEEAIIAGLKKQLADLQPSTKDSEKLDKEIDSLYERIEKLAIQIYGKSDRGSPSFLELKK